MSMLRYVEDWMSPDAYYGLGGYLFTQLEVAVTWILTSLEIPEEASPSSSPFHQASPLAAPEDYLL